MSRKPLSHFLFHFCVFRIICEVVPFPAIVVMIVELFRTVRVGDVAAALGSKAVVLVAEDRERGLVPGGIGISHRDGEGISFQLSFWRFRAG